MVFGHFSDRPLGGVLLVLALVVLCTAAAAFDVRAVWYGLLVAGVVYPRLAGVHLARLSRDGRLIPDGSPVCRQLSIRGMPVGARVQGLRNACFLSDGQMQRTLGGLALVRLLVFVAGMLVSAFDVCRQLSAPLSAGLVLALAALAWCVAGTLDSHDLLRIAEGRTWLLACGTDQGMPVRAAFVRRMPGGDPVPVLSLLFSMMPDWRVAAAGRLFA